MNDEANIIQAILGAYRFLLPEIVLVGAACVLFLGGLFRTGRHRWGWAALAALAAAALVLFLTADAAHASAAVGRAAVFAGPVVHDNLAVLVKVIALAGAALLVLLSWDEVPDRQAADYQACLLLVTAGVCLTGAANDLIVLFLALELISIPTYVMLYLPRHDRPAQEAALKYFLLSLFSSGLLLFGFSYLYGLAGTTNLPALFDVARQGQLAGDLPALAPVAVIFIVAGLGFRITAVPFHFYAPDVYQGTATCMAALLAFVPKVAGFAALLRVLGFVMPGVAGQPEAVGTALSAQAPILLWFLAAVTMFVGNLLALWQDNLKRLLAYSSVAHAGYMLVALAVAPYLRPPYASAGGPDGVEALLFYLVAYGVMTLGAFGIISYLDKPQKPVETVDDLSGLSQSRPLAALAMALFLFSLIGIPLTAGFLGKLQVFFGAMAVESPQHAGLFRWLALLGMLNAAIAAYYYLRIVGVMYLRPPLRLAEAGGGRAGLVAVAACAVLTVALTLPPLGQWLTDAARDATTSTKVAAQLTR